MERTRGHRPPTPTAPAPALSDARFARDVGTWGPLSLAPREGLYPRPWSRITSETLFISGAQEGQKGWALRSLHVSEPDLKVTGWR